MTRRSDLMCEDIFNCTHEPETPVIEDDGTEIIYWVCRCGQRCPEQPKKPEPTITLADIERELRKAMRHDPMRAERAVGSLYGGVFKNKEAALNPWTPPDKERP